MGSWDVSCALTGTPIFPGDECVFVLFNRTFDPLGHLEYDAKFDVELVIKSTYADYGRPACVDGIDPQYLDAVTDCLGRDGQEPGRYFFFLCKKAWDWSVARYPQKVDNEMLILIDELEQNDDTRKLAQKIRFQYEPPFQHFYEMQSVFQAFHRHHRSPLAGYWATGQYYQYFNDVLSHLELVAERLLDLSRTNLEDAEAERKVANLLENLRELPNKDAVHDILLFKRGRENDEMIFARLPFKDRTDVYFQGEGTTDAEAIGSLVCRAGAERFGMRFTVVDDPEGRT